MEGVRKNRVKEEGELGESIHGGMTVIWINIMITTSTNSKTGPYLCCQGLQCDQIFF